MPEVFGEGKAKGKKLENASGEDGPTVTHMAARVKGFVCFFKCI